MATYTCYNWGNRREEFFHCESPEGDFLGQGETSVFTLSPSWSIKDTDNPEAAKLLF